MNEAISIVSHVMLHVPVASLPNLYLGSVGVGRSEIRNT